MKRKDIPTELSKYCIYLNEEEYLCPERFDRMEIGWYINHSDAPNIANTHDTYSPALMIPSKRVQFMQSKIY